MWAIRSLPISEDCIVVRATAWVARAISVDPLLISPIFSETLDETLLTSCNAFLRAAIVFPAFSFTAVSGSFSRFNISVVRSPFETRAKASPISFAAISRRLAWSSASFIIRWISCSFLISFVLSLYVDMILTTSWCLSRRGMISCSIW